ncbi:dihydrofolate reductase family protein [Gordonia phosphorivorans]|uniref:Dihydrofolate reductase family protein n=1 Tax=Gordonia phosphorivorans TaxID=1056982 RepID=A0ABV6H916_9ACTN
MNREELFSQYAWPDGPWLRTNFVFGIDASITVDGTSSHLSGPTDNALLHHLRGTADLVLVGAATASAENYIGVKLPDDEERRRRERGHDEPPPLAVVTRSGRVGEPDRFLRQTTVGNYLILTGDDARARRSAEEAVERSEGTMTLLLVEDLPGAIEALHDLGYAHILCEGGPRLAASLAADGLVDEYCLTLSPSTGGRGQPDVNPQAAHRYRPAFSAVVDDFLFSRWIRGAD